MRVVKNIIKDGAGAICVKCKAPATHKVIKDGKDFPVCEAHKPTMIDLLKANGYIANLKGKEYVLYSGLLDLAHRNGLKEMSCEIVHLDRKEQFCMVKATIKGDRGTFVAHGDADPSNTGKMVLSAYIRMAETRAYARCLRIFLGCGMTAKEELPPQE
jgi:hypothetical protein